MKKDFQKKNFQENEYQEKASMERAVLVGVDIADRETGGQEEFERSMKELSDLAEACMMEPVAIITQKLLTPDKGLYIGSGKAKEVCETAEKLEADIILFNDVLTPSQLRNLQEELQKPVMDRTSLILDIFRSRARTSEAKLQVETARLQYLLPRLVGMHKALTRQGGTSGSMSARGAGEKKLELDRRRIEHRLTELKRELEKVSQEKTVQRKKRQESGIPLVALVGYTNAGKSTLMNAMVDRYVQEEEKRVLEKDMLFATLDTTVRRINTGNNRDFLLSDTVGFIEKLPHSLIQSFQSTLEEVKNADLLLQVVDYSDAYHAEQMETTKKTLEGLGAGSIPMITVYNKMDLQDEIGYPKLNGDKIYISAKEDKSLEMLAEMILQRIYADFVKITLVIPYDKGSVVSHFRENAHIIKQEYVQEGTELTVRCHEADKNKYAEYIKA